jgi:hypothetical protein
LLPFSALDKRQQFHLSTSAIETSGRFRPQGKIVRDKQALLSKPLAWSVLIAMLVYCDLDLVLTTADLALRIP